MSEHNKQMVGVNAPRLTKEQHMEALAVARKVLTQRASEVTPMYLSQHEEWLLAACVISFDEQHAVALDASQRFRPTIIENTLKREDVAGSDPALQYKDHMSHLNHLAALLDSDERAILLNDTMYQASWKKRGGNSAFENLCRKWDRLYARCECMLWDVFTAIRDDKRREGVIDDVRDLRRYLALVECEAINRGLVQVQTTTNGDDVK